MGLKINEEKTKYMTTRVNKHQPKHFQIENFNFQTVQSLNFWVLFWMSTMIILLKLEKEFNAAASVVTVWCRQQVPPKRWCPLPDSTATILVFIAVKMLTLLYGCEQIETFIYCCCQKHRWQHLLDSATVRHLSTKLWGLQLFNSNPRVSAIQFYVVVKPSFMNQGEISEAGVGRLPESPVACRSKLNCLFWCNDQLRKSADT